MSESVNELAVTLPLLSPSPVHLLSYSPAHLFTRSPFHSQSRVRPVRLLTTQGEQPQALHLPRRTFRQRGDQAKCARRLVASKLLEAVRAELCFVAAHARLEHDAGQDILTIHRVGNAHRGGLEHSGMAHQRLVDLARRDVLAALDDQLLEPAGDEVEPVNV